GCQFACNYCYAVKEEDASAANQAGALVKTNLVGILKKKLDEIPRHSKKITIRPSIAIGGITDPYQEAEKEMMITKSCIELISEKEYPLQIFTKSDLILRDADIISSYSSKGLAAVNVTIFTLNESHWRVFETHTPHPEARLELISSLKKRDILCGILLAPIFPYLNDSVQDIENIFKAAKKIGAEYIIPGCYRPLNSVVKKRMTKILKERFKNVLEKFNSIYGLSTCVNANYSEMLEKTLLSLSKKYEIPLSIPVPVAKPVALTLNVNPVS
ncbi:MAG: radical SAM protein, partial [Elusimicrobiota bacterium]